MYNSSAALKTVNCVKSVSAGMSAPSGRFNFSLMFFARVPSGKSEEAVVDTLLDVPDPRSSSASPEPEEPHATPKIENKATKASRATVNFRPILIS